MRGERPPFGTSNARGVRASVRRLVAQIGTEPALYLLGRHALTASVVDDLVAVDLPEREVARFRMGEVEAADARAGPHGEGLREEHAGALLHVEELPQRPLFGVVRARGVAGGGADPAVLLGDELIGGEVLGLAEAPVV